MEAVEILGIILIFTILTIIDWPKIQATQNSKKYSAVYLSIVAVGILIGALAALNLIPDYSKTFAFIFQKMTGSKQ